MKEYKWKKFKLACKKRFKLLLGSGIFLLCGIICWIIGAFLSGENPIKWLTSPFAITIYTCLAVVLLFVGFVVIWEYRNSLGGGNDK